MMHNDEQSQSMTTARKIAVSAVLLVAMGVIYRVYLRMWSACSLSDTVELTSLLWLFTKLGLMAALLFGVVANREAEWSSTDAGRTASLAYFGLVSFNVMTSHCACSVLPMFIPFVPFVIGATLGHEIGRATRA